MPGRRALRDFVLTEAIDQAAILLHDAGDTVDCPVEQWDYLPQAIDALKARGFDFGVVEPADRPSAINQGSWIACVVRRGDGIRALASRRGRPPCWPRSVALLTGACQSAHADRRSWTPRERAPRLVLGPRVPMEDRRQRVAQRDPGAALPDRP